VNRDHQEVVTERVSSTGAYYPSEGPQSVLSGIGVGRFLARPIFLSTFARWTAAALEIGTPPGANHFLHFAMYADDGEGYPGLRLCYPGVLTIPNAAPVAMYELAGFSEWLAPGLVWIAMLHKRQSGTTALQVRSEPTGMLPGLGNLSPIRGNLGLTAYGLTDNTLTEPPAVFPAGIDATSTATARVWPKLIAA
jgi:hypothetical protein